MTFRIRDAALLLSMLRKHALVAANSACSAEPGRHRQRWPATAPRRSGRIRWPSRPSRPSEMSQQMLASPRSLFARDHSADPLRKVNGTGLTGGEARPSSTKTSLAIQQSPLRLPSSRMTQTELGRRLQHAAAERVGAAVADRAGASSCRRPAKPSRAICERVCAVEQRRRRSAPAPPPPSRTAA